MSRVIECPECHKRNCIYVHVICSIPVEIDEHDEYAWWDWTKAKTTNSAVSEYQCYECNFSSHDGTSITDDFVVEDNDE